MTSLQSDMRPLGLDWGDTMSKKGESKKWGTTDEINFLEHIESWTITPGNPIDMLDKYIHANRDNWELINRGKAIAYAQKRLASLRLKV